VEFPLRGQKVLVIIGDAKRTTVSHWWFCQGRGRGGGKKGDYYSIRGICLLSYTSYRGTEYCTCTMRSRGDRVSFYQRDLKYLQSYSSDMKVEYTFNEGK
jgi:hypothetical protein